MTLVLASNNPKKLREMQALLAGTGFVLQTLRDRGICSEPEETGESFAENAFIKAEAAFRATGCASLADDSGLCVDALDGAPGVHSARFGGFDTDAERNAHLLRLMTYATDRSACFITHIVCLLPDASSPAGYRRLDAEGRCEGVVLTAPRGAGGFGYDPLFFVPALGRSFAELSPAEKNRLSHRGRALASLRQLLVEAVV